MNQPKWVHIDLFSAITLPIAVNQGDFDLPSILIAAYF